MKVSFSLFREVSTVKKYKLIYNGKSSSEELKVERSWNSNLLSCCFPDLGTLGKGQCRVHALLIRLLKVHHWVKKSSKHLRPRTITEHTIKLSQRSLIYKYKTVCFFIIQSNISSETKDDYCCDKVTCTCPDLDMYLTLKKWIIIIYFF